MVVQFIACFFIDGFFVQTLVCIVLNTSATCINKYLKSGMHLTPWKLLESKFCDFKNSNC